MTDPHESEQHSRNAAWVTYPSRSPAWSSRLGHLVSRLVFLAMADPQLRYAVRAIVLDDANRVLLCRFDLPTQAVVVWATPGGGVEHEETQLEALRRELHEEIGLALETEPPHVWHQRIVAQGHAEGYDGVVNDYYMIKTDGFEPQGSIGAEMLLAENITHFRWWTLEELGTHRGEAVFAPRNLAALLTELLRDGVPAEPRVVGL